MEKMVNMKDLFSGTYSNKRVLVTGHTGFKGSWLALWLAELGAQVTGVSKYIPTIPNHFEAAQLGSRISDCRNDIRSIEDLEKVFTDFNPEIVFHLAAQPIVRDSYNDPKLTFDTNVGGTVNMLECIRHSSSVKTAVIITSDKCYENVGWAQGYKETDRLGGADPYSASKACAEIAFSAYFRSFFGPEKKIRIATTRAGNVIGGGDWANDRIVPDCVKAISQNRKIIIRHPDATRPWQHVLEPLSGYLWLGANLYNGLEGINGESFNFGPKENVVESVGELADLFIKYWGQGAWDHVQAEGKKKEAKLLQLSCQKAKQHLLWEPLLTFDETVKLTAEWYKSFYKNEKDIYQLSLGNIQQYVQKAVVKQAVWAAERVNA